MRKLHADPDFAKAHAEANRNKRCLCGQAGHYAKTCPNWRGVEMSAPPLSRETLALLRRVRPVEPPIQERRGR